MILFINFQIAAIFALLILLLGIIIGFLWGIILINSIVRKIRREYILIKKRESKDGR